MSWFPFRWEQFLCPAYLVCVCVQMCVTHVGMGVRGFSNLGIPGIEHKSSGLAAGAFIH